MAFTGRSGKERYIYEPDTSDSGSYDLVSPKSGWGWADSFRGQVSAWMFGKATEYVRDPSKLGDDYYKIRATIDTVGGKVSSLKQGFRSNQPRTRLAGKRSGNDGGKLSISGSGSAGGYSSGGGGKGSGGKGKSTGGAGGKGNAGYGGAGVVADKVQLTFESGIPSGLFNNPKERDNSSFSSLYVMGGKFLPNYSSSRVSKSNASQLIVEDVYWDYLTRAEQEINRIIEPHFSKIEFLTWLYHVSDGLQLYYEVDSIMSYDSEFENKNVGMAYLRETKINSKVIDGHLRLKKVLERQAFPPKLYDFIRYIFQNFTFGECESSPIYRLGLDDSLFDFGDSSADFADGSKHNLIIANINETNQINSYMVRAFSDWKIGSMKPSTSQVIIDPQFRNFWYNSSVCYMPASLETAYSVEVASKDINYNYGMFTDKVDGLFYAMTSLWDESAGDNGAIQSGLWEPWAPSGNVAIQNRTNLACHGQGMHAVSGQYRRDQCGVRILPEYSIGDSAFQLYSTTPCDMQHSQVHSINNMKMALSESVRFLFNPKGE
jgi:hypothetical protein